MPSSELDQNSFLDMIKDRLNHPLLGPYIFSWLIHNWKIPMAIVFSAPPELDRIVVVEQLIRALEWIDIFWIPAAFAVLYFFISPTIASLSEMVRAWTNQRAKLNQAKLDSDYQEIQQYRDTLRVIVGDLLSQNRMLRNVLGEVGRSLEHTQPIPPAETLKSLAGYAKINAESAMSTRDELSEFFQPTGTWDEVVSHHTKRFRKAKSK